MLLQENTMFANRYQLERLLGRGGFSEVWLAKDSYTKLDIAIKVYAPGQGMDSDGLADFSQELAGVFNLNHTNLLKPTHVDAWEGMPYLIMSFCSRGSLTKQIGKLSEQELWHVLHDVAAGLAYLHKNDIVHQDIKPDNILLDESGNYVITDFGISTKARSTLRKSVIGGAVSGGTMAYMGPERFSKQPAPTKASDIWSLGAMMFELITGNVPFGEMGGGMQKGGAEIPEITEGVSFELNKTIEQMLALETWDRPTADKLTEIASAHLSAMPTPAPQKEVRSTIPQQPKQEQPSSSRETQRFVSNDIAENPREEVVPVEPIAKAPVKKKRKWWILVIILVVLVIAQRIWNWYVTRPATTEEVTPAGQVVESKESNNTLEISKFIYDERVSYEAIDLGLSVKWASCNVGANSPEQYGDYFAWGETSKKNTYTWANYQWKVLEQSSWSYKKNDIVRYTPKTAGLKYVSNNIIGTDADVATTNWGNGWRMPNSKEMKELLNKCKWEVGTLNGVYGIKVIGSNGNWIFLPAAGYIDGESHKQVGEYGYYSMGFLWGANSKDKPCSIWFNTSGGHMFGDYDFYLGHTIRPVHP